MNEEKEEKKVLTYVSCSLREKEGGRDEGKIDKERGRERRREIEKEIREERELMELCRIFIPFHLSSFFFVFVSILHDQKFVYLFHILASSLILCQLISHAFYQMLLQTYCHSYFSPLYPIRVLVSTILHAFLEFFLGFLLFLFFFLLLWYSSFYLFSSFLLFLTPALLLSFIESSFLI